MADPRRMTPEEHGEAHALLVKAVSDPDWQAASQALDASAAKLSRMETGRQTPGPRDVRDLCKLYAVDPDGLSAMRFPIARNAFSFTHAPQTCTPTSS